MKLYHGTTKESASSIVQDGIILSKSRKSVDFGKGFYTTPSKDFAKKCALWKSDYNIDNACIIELEVSESRLLHLNVRSFDSPSREWAQYVINNRNGLPYVTALEEKNHNLFPLKYDISIGPTADEDVVEIARKLKRNKKILSDQDYKQLTRRVYNTQFVFHTPDATRNITLRILEKEEWPNEKNH